LRVPRPGEGGEDPGEGLGELAVDLLVVNDAFQLDIDKGELRTRLGSSPGGVGRRVPGTRGALRRRYSAPRLPRGVADHPGALGVLPPGDEEHHVVEAAVPQEGEHRTGIVAGPGDAQGIVVADKRKQDVRFHGKTVARGAGAGQATERELRVGGNRTEKVELPPAVSASPAGTTATPALADAGQTSASGLAGTAQHGKKCSS
jgi:hypothetical protein